MLKSTGHAVALDDIEKKTGLDKTGIKNSVKHLRESGVEIDTTTHGYLLHRLPENILPALLSLDLKCRVMGREIHSYKTVASTNELAKRLADSGAPEGTLVISERQTRGRGRHGRSWHSPSGLGLYFTLVLRPDLDFGKMPALPLVAGLSVCSALDKYAGQEARIKWPNDCLLQGKKVAARATEGLLAL